MLLVIAGLGATLLRRNVELMLAAAEAGDDAGYDTALRTTRTWMLITLVLIVLTIFAMTAKPFA